MRHATLSQRFIFGYREKKRDAYQERTSEENNKLSNRSNVNNK